MSAPLTPHLEILPNAQRALWPELRDVPPDFVLYGGTGLALRLGHRHSVDFDFFSSEPLKHSQLRRRLPFLATAETLQEDADVLTVSVARGGPVKVSFFGPIGFGRVGTPQRTDLAMSLDSLGSSLIGLGRREEALEAAREAMGLFRQLAKARPETFDPYLAESLNNLGKILNDLRRREEALEATRESVGIRRQLAKAGPEAFNPDLAASLNNLGRILSDLGRGEEALETTRESANIRRQLAKALPESFNSDLAASLNNLGRILSDLGRREEALGATSEAVDIRRQLAKAHPEAFNPDLAASDLNARQAPDDSSQGPAAPP